MSDRKLRIAVAGAGAFGREHLRALSRIDRVEIAGVADVHAPAAEAAVADFGAMEGFSDAAGMLEKLRPDGVIVATPGHTHVALATAAVALGIPVLLEKPVGLSAADADILINAERRSPAFILPGHILRFSEPYRTVVGIAQSGALGAVLSVTLRNHRDQAHAARYPDIDPVHMTMVHDIDLALWITGGALLSALALRRPEATFRSETLVTGCDSSGAMWHVSNAWTLPTEAGPPDRVEVVCSQGSVEMDVGVAIRVFGASPREIDLSDGPQDDMLRTEVEAFLRGIETGVAPDAVTLRDARNGLAAADAILRSLRTGRLEGV